MSIKKLSVLSYIFITLSFLFLVVGVTGMGDEKDLVESAAPYIKPSSSKVESHLLTALAIFQEQMLENLFSASMILREATVNLPSGRGTQCTLQGITAGWFDLYHQVLISGNLLGEAELSADVREAVIDDNLAYSLWGTDEVVGNTLYYLENEFKVVGIVKHNSHMLQYGGGNVYIPLLAAIQLETPADAQVISTQNVLLHKFEATAKIAMPGCSVYSFHKEKMRAELPLRYLFVLFAISLLPRLLSAINSVSRQSLKSWKTQQSRVYGHGMILPSLLLGLQFALSYGALMLAVYFVLQTAVAPAFVFTEWMPQDPSRLTSYQNMLKELMVRGAALNRTITETIQQLRIHSSFVKAGVVLLLIALALPRRLVELERL